VGLTCWNPLWSLSIEELFYLAFPFVCLALGRLRVALWLGLVVVATAVYLRMVQQANLYTVDGCMDLLAVGCVLALCRPERLRGRFSGLKAWLMSVGLCLAGLANLAYWVLFFHPNEAANYGVLCSGFSAVFVIVASHVIQPGRVVSWLLWPLSFVGVISYEVYLLHMPVRGVVEGRLQAHFGWLLAAVVLVSAFAHYVFAEPLNKRLRRPESPRGDWVWVAWRAALLVGPILLAGWWLRGGR
jgi:peptidoglycan/LPS O-acetylase OafA/YrhL